MDDGTRNGLIAFLDKLAVLNPKAVPILFGSRARGDHLADSDADVLVIVDHEPDAALYQKLSDIAFEALVESGVRVQPVAIAASAWKAPDTAPNPAFLRTIAREGVMLR